MSRDPFPREVADRLMLCLHNGLHERIALAAKPNKWTMNPEVERFPGRLSALRRHADLAIRAARDEVSDSAGLEDCEKRQRAFDAAANGMNAPAGVASPSPTRG